MEAVREEYTKFSLLLGQIESHVHHNFIDSVQLLGTGSINIPGEFTSVHQPSDAGIMKPFKTRFIEQCLASEVSEYTRVRCTGKISIPGRVQVLE